MFRLLFAAFAVTVVASNLRAEEVVPERLLSPTTQVYLRWDGYTTHRDAYRKSARGQMFAGEMSKTFEGLLARAQIDLRTGLLGQPLLDGSLPDELQKIGENLKAAFKVPGLILDSGIVAGLEIRPPSFGIDTIKALVLGKSSSELSPTIQATFIFPNLADKSEPFAAMKLITQRIKTDEIKQPGRTLFAAQPEPDVSVVWWAEGKHFVLVIGNVKPELVAVHIKPDGAGITNHPLYKQLQEFKEFTTVTRGFIDGAAIGSLMQKVIKAMAPEAAPVLEATGLLGVKGVRIYEGFEGEFSRGVVEIDIPGPRKGLTKIFGGAPVTTKELPPLPAEAVRWIAVRMDLKTIADTLLLIPAGYGELTEFADPKEVGPEAALRIHREQLNKLVDDAIGFKLTDLFNALGDKVLSYSTLSDGLFSIGQVIAVSVKDEKAVRKYMDLLMRKAESAASGSVRIRKRLFHGVETRELAIKERSPVTPTYAVVDGWLVMAFQPQPVQGFILRAKDNLPTWKPDPRTEATLAKVPQDRFMLQYADPRPGLTLILNSAPIFGGLASSSGEPFDVGIFPHSEAACRPLFPNVAWARDDGKVMRWESKDSLWMPLEVIGPEIFLAYGLAISAFF